MTRFYAVTGMGVGEVNNGSYQVVILPSWMEKNICTIVFFFFLHFRTLIFLNLNGESMKIKRFMIVSAFAFAGLLAGTNVSYSTDPGSCEADCERRVCTGINGTCVVATFASTCTANSEGKCNAW